jgi:GAF domain-containing protein
MDPQEAFIQLGRIPMDQWTLTQVLSQVAELAKATIPGADEVSVTLVEEAGADARSVAFTGDLAVQLDERQYERGFGPCMDACLGGTSITISDTATEERYSDFGAVAARAGVRSSLSVGMPVPQRTVGGLNLYSRSAHAFDADAKALAQAFADYAAVALVNAALVDSKTALARQMEEAMASRAVIEQAKGILMARLACTADEAFTHLSRQSQRTNRKLRDVATELVASATRPPTS